MPSPFPGMDPWLEGSLWPDVHSTLLPQIRTALVKVLPERYSALIGQHVWLEGADEDERVLLGVPDVNIPEVAIGTQRKKNPRRIAAPVVTELPAIQKTGHRYLRITDREQRRLVTVVELLSPSNKDSGKNRPHYLEKRNEYLATGVNLVEIDLLRAGERMPLGGPPPTPSDYLYVILRSATFPRVELWPIYVRDELPPLPVPLDDDESDAVIDLRAALDVCYDGARYDRLARYEAPPDPPLAKSDASWAGEILAKFAKKRKK